MDNCLRHITRLYYRQQNGELSPAEEKELSEWLADHPYSQQHLADLFEQEGLSELYLQRSPATMEKLRNDIYALVQPSLNNENKTTFAVHRVHFLRKGFLKYAAAIIIIFGIGAYLWNKQNNSNTLTQTQPASIKNDALPGTQKAMLTLADGRQIVLDSAANGQLAVENGSEIIKKDGRIIYDAGQLTNSGITYNTMSTPKGGQYQLTLIDGTKVWLNAASSITYPTAFTGKAREVQVTGEAYFEVAKNKSLPFVVKTGKENITVLGTSFNINRYTDEPQGKISLVDGVVKVNNQLLQPGQAYVEGKIIKTNIAQDVAWKNGAFDFNNLTLEQAARQIGRWYNVEIKFEGTIPKTEIYGGVSRAVTLQRLIQGMEGEFAHFDLQGKVLVIKSL